jgi:hypothetical protein
VAEHRVDRTHVSARATHAPVEIRHRTHKHIHRRIQQLREAEMAFTVEEDFQRQGLLYLPRNLPPPSDPRFSEHVAEVAWPLIRANGGRAFVLCTTLRAVDGLMNFGFCCNSWRNASKMLA